MLKFVLLYLLVLAIILIFNYGAHFEARMENELLDNEDDSLKQKKPLRRVDEHSCSGRVTHGIV